MSSHGGETDPNSIASCLLDYGVKNFVLHPKNGGNDDGYFKLLSSQTQNLRYAEPWHPKPAAIVTPVSKEELVCIVRCCRKSSWEIRVRCGGHSYEGTSAVVASIGNPFVVIDMAELDEVTVDLESQTAWVEGGATLGQIYYAISTASDSGLGFSAGSCPTVGAGGHIAGGGFGMFSRKYGIAADNVMDAILVDADGQVLNRKAMREEVFWAIRGGGGGNWGIIYAWKIQLLEVPKTVTCFIVSRPGTKQYILKLINKWQHIAPKLDDDFYLSAFMGAGLPETKGVVGISTSFKGCFLGPRKKTLSILNQTFPELGILEKDCREMRWIDSIVFFAGFGDAYTFSDMKNRHWENKFFFKAKSDYVKSPLPINGLSSAIEALEMEPKGYIILDPYGGAMDRISSDAIAFPHRKGNMFSIQYLVEWYEDDNHNCNKFLEWIRGFYAQMTPYVSYSPRSAYINYIDFDLGVHDYLDQSSRSRVPTTDHDRNSDGYDLGVLNYLNQEPSTNETPMDDDNNDSGGYDFRILDCSDQSSKSGASITDDNSNSAGYDLGDVNYLDQLSRNEAHKTNDNISGSYKAVENAKLWGEKYFLNNYDRLVRAKTIIDPFNIFRHQQSIPPLFTLHAQIKYE